MPHPQPIAVVGLGGLFPSASTLERYWEVVSGAHCVARDVPPERWPLPAEHYYDPRPGLEDRVYSVRGCFLEPLTPDLTGLDCDPAWLPRLDPLFGVTLHAGRQAFFDAASHGRWDRTRVGVILANLILPTETASRLTREILGNAMGAQLGLSLRAPDWSEVDPVNRHAAGLPAALLSRALGLGGGAFTLDAACASSLYAIKLACEELRAGRADAMLAGGVSRPDCLFTQMGFSQLRALSPSGWPRPFDERADGLVVGEGAGIFVLRRLEDALRDGDRIAAVIHGLGISNDTGGSLLAPDSEGQLRALRAAYRETGWSPGEVDLIECHATGTSRGDATELASLATLWTGETPSTGGCVLGSAKSNVGHLLTAAGSAGLMKVILALRARMLPPTANFERSLFDFAASPFRVLTRSEPWPVRDATTPRRAAVSAFGFGGINAHLLVEEWRPEGAPARAVRMTVPALTPDAPSPIAIIGIETRFGTLDSRREFQEAVLTGTSNLRARPPRRWFGLDPDPDPATTGAFLLDLQIAIARFRISPNELQAMLPQQLLMLLAADGALSDAHLPAGDGNRTGVFVGIGLDFNAANFHLRWTAALEAEPWARELALDLDESATRERWVTEVRNALTPPLTADRTLGALGGMVASRVAREFHVGGCAFTLQGDENSGLHALAAGMEALRRGELDLALVGAVDITGDLRSVLTQHTMTPLSSGEAPQPFDLGADGTVLGEGVVCLVLKRLEEAQRDGNRVYALIKGHGCAGSTGDRPVGASAEAYRRALERAYAAAQVSPGEVGYLMTHGSGTPAEDALEAHSLREFFGEAQPRTPITLGSLKPVIGHTGAASGLASVAATALLLYQEILPPFQALRLRPELDGDSCFDVPAEPQYWYRDRARGPRRAGVSSIGADGVCTHVVLEEFAPHPDQEVDRAQPLGARPEGLFVLEANDPTALLAELQRLEQWLAAPPPLAIEGLARAWWTETGQHRERRLAAAMVARDREELLQQLTTVRRWITSRDELRANDRVFYSAHPLGAESDLAFVFPGSGNRYEGMGLALSAQWPELLRRLDRENQLLRSQFSPRPDLTDHRSLIFGHVSHGMLLSDLLQAHGVRPQAVLGYSLGESASYIATRVWSDHDSMVARMNASPLFGTELVGPCEAARRAWRLSPGEAVDWQVGVVDCPAERVRAALAGRKRVYLLIVNTPAECVLGGQQAAVDELVRDLGCLFLPLKNVPTVHCEVTREVRDAYHAIHRFECTPPPGVRFYSGAWGHAFPLTPERCADSILAGALDGIDFPRVIQQAYDDGVRLFVEVGPRNSCTRMIGRILGDQPHVARSACVQGQDPVSTVLRLLGHLLAERVPVDLTPLYGAATQCTGHRIPPPPPARAITVPLGGAVRLPARPSRDLPPPTTTATEAPPPFATRTRVAPPPALPTIPLPGPAAPLVTGLLNAQTATVAAHETYLRLSARSARAQQGLLQLQLRLLSDPDVALVALPSELTAVPVITVPAAGATPAPFLDRAQCVEFARGSISRVLGPRFAEVEAYPTRVRLPDDPLNYVDRMIEVEGVMGELGPGRLVTEHDLRPDAWYLDGGVMPAGQAVEAGQADLFLSAYLGIDLRTRGLSKYRLLDAVVSYHSDAPRPGQTLRYDIRIEKFMRQGDTYMFFFNFDGFVDGRPLMTMREGCAGFFTDQQLAEGRGIVFTEEDRLPQPGRLPADWRPLTPMQREAFDETRLTALRAGDLVGAFGPAFDGLAVERPLTIPGGIMSLIHRVTVLEPQGGRYGLGLIRAEIDIAPDDWFLRCHFVDDPVMPGTLMYDSCLHALRVFLLRMGWVGEDGVCAWEPVPGLGSRLRCRGQVIPGVQRAVYELSIKELGYRPEPYAIADALMSADGHDIVLVQNMTLRLTGTTREQLEQRWARRSAAGTRSPHSTVAPATNGGGETPARSPEADRKPAVYDYDRILNFSIGKPSLAFGDRYAPFDDDRVIARLPGPPYLFLSRITEVQGEPWVMKPGAHAEAQYDVPPDAWYFRANRQASMPYSVALEFPLQACGWLAAYCGAALTSEQNLHFRNLDGSGVLYEEVLPNSGTLTSRVELLSVSQSAGMIIMKFSMRVTRGRHLMFEGETGFGFFSDAALDQQVGVRGTARYQPTAEELQRARSFAMPDHPPLTPDDSGGELVPGLALPSVSYRMADHVELWIPDGGPHRLGFIRGTKVVNPAEWFFTAHFYQDPVWPGSLGLESFLQLLKVVAVERWGSELGATHRFEPIALGVPHRWRYRGQIVRNNRNVVVEAAVTQIDDEQHLIKADGFLTVDGLTIYQMTDYAIRAVPVR